jgi:antitoxin component YwqK of YwqJK toxin-antitoxin module
MNKRILAIFLLKIILLGSCNFVKDKDSIQIKKENYSNGNIKSEAAYVNDSIKNGWCKLYYESGKLHVLKNYKMGHEEGVQIGYYENGRKEVESYFLSGLQDGKTCWYYESGKIRIENFWKSGIQIREEKYYYPNGKIKQYRVYDNESILRFMIKYDSLGNFINKEGRLIVATIYKSPIKVGRDMTADFIIAYPPNSAVNAYITETDTETKSISNNMHYILDSCRINYKTIYKKSGKYQIVTKINIDDSVHKQSFFDNDTITVEVVP